MMMGYKKVFSKSEKEMTRSIFRVGCIAAAATAVFFYSGARAGDGGRMSQADRANASYGFGYNLGQGYRAERIPIAFEKFMDGFRDGLKGDEPKIDKRMYNRSIAKMNTHAEQSLRDYLSEQGGKNRKKGKEFMDLNGHRKGVKTLESGLQVEVLKSGSPGGRRPDRMDLARVTYKGSLIDGTIFEDNTQEAVWIPVGGVIPGWSQAMKMMRPGDKWRIVIPPQLGYGKEGNPPDIGAMATLIFELEIHELKRIQTKKVKSNFGKPRGGSPRRSNRASKSTGNSKTKNNDKDSGNDFVRRK